ncbi:MAG: hypothetical protein MI864_04270 [Pseudomonadales bacterium]|nr:hypothetical protein [Pseudomonadales bacterium]
MQDSQTERQPDIEIYIKNTSLNAIQNWLGSIFHSIETLKSGKQSLELSCNYQDTKFPVTILEAAAGKKYTSVWFKSNATPWQDDLECARAAYQALESEVRCSNGGWQEGDDVETTWWCVNENGVELKIWNA